jgi:hypothetical protein
LPFFNTTPFLSTRKMLLTMALSKKSHPPKRFIHVAKANQDVKETKSLSRLSQLFLRCFLVGHQTLSLPQASDKIHGETTSMEDLAALGCKNRCDIPTDAKLFQQAAMRGLKTKIRRLYDIGNVFLSMGLLAKVDERAMPMEARRPRLTWSYRLNAKEIQQIYKRMSEQMKSERNPFDNDTKHSPLPKEEEEEDVLYTSTTPSIMPAPSLSLSQESSSSFSTSCPSIESERRDVPDDDAFLANIHLTGGAVDELAQLRRVAVHFI